jgi:type II secretory pathway pseudopilin PulG
LENKIKFLKKKNISVIEWLVVIVLMSLLFISTLPKFSNLTVDARNAANYTLSQTFQTTVAAVHQAWNSNGSPTVANGSNVVVDGQVIHVNYLGWPDNNKGLLLTQSDCAVLWNTLLNNAPIAGCVDCRESCTAIATNGCYITSARNAACVFTLSTNAGIGMKYSLATGMVEWTSE